jgi:putative Holliday junction resolvase
MPKYLGIDYGEKRIGLATAENYDAAAGVKTVTSLDEVIAFINENGPFESVVLGLPRGMEGNDTLQTTKVREVAGELSDRLGFDVEFADEFDTSNMAKMRLLESGRAFKQEDIDAEAAAIILDDFLVGHE